VSRLACAWCFRAAEKNAEMSALRAGANLVYVDFDARSANEEILISKSKAALAARFAIPLDAVDIAVSDVNGNLVIKYASIFLSAQDIDRLISPQN